MEVKNVRYHGKVVESDSQKFRKYIGEALYHAKVLFSGFKRMLYGAATAGAFAMAGYGFYAIPSEGGYVAVFDFIAAAATLFVAVVGMYAQGKPGNKQKKG